MLPRILPGSHVDLLREASQALERRDILCLAWQEVEAAVPEGARRGLETQCCCSFLLISGVESCLLPWQGVQHRGSFRGGNKGSPHGGADMLTEFEKSTHTGRHSEVQ